MNPIIICLGVGVPLLILAVLLFDYWKTRDNEVKHVFEGIEYKSDETFMWALRIHNHTHQVEREMKEKKRQGRLRIAKRKALRR